MSKTYRNVSENAKLIALEMQKKGELVKLSNTSKLGTKSWSLQALNKCPASKKPTGGLVDACKGCYATFGQYNYSNTQAIREFNDWAWRQENFVNDFIQALEGISHFRWFDSGDMYDLRLESKILQIMDRTPNTKHWLPTRMYKFEKFHAVLHCMDLLPNACVRLSSDSIIGELVEMPSTLNIDTSSTIIPIDYIYGHVKTDKLFKCPSPEQGGKCLSCRACYDKDIATIAYTGHGRVMKLNQNKLINIVSV